MRDVEVRVVVRKFDDGLHWHHSMAWLGEDEYGRWLGAPIGTVYGKGGEEHVYSSQERRVMLFPHDAWWTALFQDAPARLDAYCDVTTNPEWLHGGEVTMVDLDLDVCRTREGGAVFVDDEEEFARHRLHYGYPPDVVAHAEAATAWLSHALRNGTEPFGSRYRAWLDQVG